MKFGGSDAAAIARLSHPVWGAWIEIQEEVDTLMAKLVAPRVGCVD